MKIKLTQPGYVDYDGYFGVVLFANGVSVDDVSPIEQQRLASLISVETLEGKNPSPAQMIVDTYSDDMRVEEVIDAPEAPSAVTDYHSAETLSAIADKGGIKGLRVISDPLGIKGNSIADLIAHIVDATRVNKPAESEQVVEVSVSEVVVAK
jgi:hypothetical protein